MRRGLAALAVGALGVVACSGPPGSGSASALPSQPVASAGAPSRSPAVPSPAPSEPGSPASSSPSSPDGSGIPAPSNLSGDLVLDPTLLAVLPPDLDGIPVTQEPGSFAAAAADPAFARDVGSAAFAIVVDGADLASGVVARLRPGRYSEKLFRDWRDTYNTGACAQAGGVVGNAETELGGRTVHIASCAGGLRVYHAYVAERDEIVSLFSVGDRRFGERLMGDLRP